MATPFDRLIETVSMSLPGASATAIKQELFDVCLEFFKKSDAWREDITFEVKPYQTDAYIAPFAGRINRLMFVTTRPALGSSGEPVERGLPVRGAYLPDPSTIRVRVAPTALEGYIANVSLTVNDPTTRDALPIVPADLIERYYAELQSGLLARMMAQPSKPYTNVSLASYHLRAFSGATSRARNEVAEGYLAGGQAWRFPSNFTRS